MLQLAQELIDAKVSFAGPVHLQLIYTPLISLQLFKKSSFSERSSTKIIITCQTTSRKAQAGPSLLARLKMNHQE